MDYTNKLHIIYGDAALGVQTKKFQYIFSYEKGGLESLKINNKEWLYRIPTPTFWRATTDNDRGNGFSVKAAHNARLIIPRAAAIVNSFFAPARNKIPPLPGRKTSGQ